MKISKAYTYILETSCHQSYSWIRLERDIPRTSGRLHNKSHKVDSIRDIPLAFYMIAKTKLTQCSRNWMTCRPIDWNRCLGPDNIHTAQKDYIKSTKQNTRIEHFDFPWQSLRGWLKAVAVVNQKPRISSLFKWDIPLLCNYPMPRPKDNAVYCTNHGHSTVLASVRSIGNRDDMVWEQKP